jgi:hypothetical protein
VAPLRVRDVRVASAAASDTGTASVNESDVIGLISDLGARPLKGPGYAAGRVAFVNPAGAMETVSGTATDCVRVDGSSGPCGTAGGASPSFVDNDALIGLVDGANTNFALTGVPNPASSLALYRNGMLLNAGQDFTANGNAIQFVAAAVPQAGDTLLASYRLSGSDSGTPQLFPPAEVLCAGTGTATGSATMASVGTCIIPGGYLAAGDRIEIRFDLEHSGSAGGFSFELHWGGSTVLHRDAAAADVLARVRADAALAAGGAQLSHQSWGTVLAFGAGVGSAADDFTAGLTLDFQALVSQAGDTVTLKNYTVVRLP